MAKSYGTGRMIPALEKNASAGHPVSEQELRATRPKWRMQGRYLLRSDSTFASSSSGSIGFARISQ